MSEASSNAVIILFAGCAAAFVLTILLIKLIGPKLPRDHGRAFAVAGELSAGKIRGAGVLMMPVLHPAALLRNPSDKPGAFEDFLRLQKLIIENCDHTYDEETLHILKNS